MDGFVKSGLVGNEKEFNSKFAFADFDHMLNTVRREVTTKEYDLCQSTLPELLKYQLENGHVPDSEYDRLGYPYDQNPCGEDVIKDATVSQECRQRAKCLSHEQQIGLRIEREELLLADEKRKVADKINRYHKLLEDNSKCEAVLANTDGSLVDYSKCTVKMLTAYIHVREFKAIQAGGRDDDWKWPNKGKIEEAVEGADKIITRAHKLKSKDIILEEPASPKPVAPEVNTRHEEATIICATPRQTIFSNEEKASRFLQMPNWASAVTKALDPWGNCTVLDINNDLLVRADLLQKQLECRLTRHCRIRIKKESKRSHWCLLWASKNMPPMAAVMVLFNHIKTDITCLDHNQCLLAASSSFLKASSNREAMMEGCYLYYDLNNEEWIRSGKATSSNFSKRHAEHKAGSMLTSASSQKSKFYNSYPSRYANLADQSVRKGEFEKLQILVGVGYNKLLKGKLTCDIAMGGIFHLNNETNKMIDGVNFRGTV